MSASQLIPQAFSDRCFLAPIAGVHVRKGCHGPEKGCTGGSSNYRQINRKPAACTINDLCPAMRCRSGHERGMRVRSALSLSKVKFSKNRRSWLHNLRFARFSPHLFSAGATGASGLFTAAGIVAFQSLFMKQGRLD
jgi:hypothetical protein